jgi:signal transduction histidine kinase
VRSWLGAPIIIRDRVIGVLTLQHREPDRFASREAGLARAFANQAAVAIENTRLHEQAQDLGAMEERQRLARDLHDAVSQTLFSASLAAEVLPRLWERMPDEGRRCLEELRLLTRGALAEMRTLLLELRPTALIEVGLDDLLRQLVEAVAGRARLPVELAIEGKCSVPPDVHVTLYRITQEALSNVTKHAGATRVSVCLECTPSVLPLSGDAPVSTVALRVEDDGCGFDPRAVPAECLGLCIMRERAQAIGAGLSIESEIGQGTQLVVVWPAAS